MKNLCILCICCLGLFFNGKSQSLTEGQRALAEHVLQQVSLSHSLDSAQTRVFFQELMPVLAGHPEFLTQIRVQLRASRKAFVLDQQHVELQRLSQRFESPYGRLIHQAMSKRAQLLLKDEAKLLPIRQLQDRKIAVLGWGNTQTAFLETLTLYTPFRYVDLASDLSGMPEASIWLILGQPLEEASQRLYLEKLQSLPSQAEKIAVVWENEALLQGIQDQLEPSTLLWAELNDSINQALSAQMLMGGEGLHTRLGKGLTTVEAGAGLSLGAKQRLQYPLPVAYGAAAQQLTAGVDSLMLAAIGAGAFPGCQVLMAHKGSVILHKAYGFHTADKQRPVQLSDLYDCASVTKVAGPIPPLLQLYGEGKINLDEPFYSYWEAFDRKDKRQLTLRLLLAHQSGMPAWLPHWKGLFNKKGEFKKKWVASASDEKHSISLGDALFLSSKFKPKKMYRPISKVKLADEPSYLYSGLVFYLLPDILSEQLGEAYDRYLYREFYHKLGAMSLRFEPYKAYPLEEIVPTETDAVIRKQLVHGRVHDEGALLMGGVSGNAGLFSNANDLAKLFQLFLNEGEYGGETYFSSQSMREFSRYQYEELQNRRGLGFDKPMLESPEKGYISPQASSASYGHSGFTGTLAWVDPENETLLIFLSNRVYPNRNNRLLYKLNIRPQLHDFLYEFEKAVTGEK